MSNFYRFKVESDSGVAVGFDDPADLDTIVAAYRKNGMKVAKPGKKAMDVVSITPANTKKMLEVLQCVQGTGAAKIIAVLYSRRGSWASREAICKKLGVTTRGFGQMLHRLARCEKSFGVNLISMSADRVIKGGHAKIQSITSYGELRSWYENPFFQLNSDFAAYLETASS